MMSVDPSSEIVVIVRGLEVLVERRAGGSGLFLAQKAVPPTFCEPPVFLGRFQDQAWYAACPRADCSLPEHLEFAPIRSLFAELPATTLHILGCALAGLEFEHEHRYCGRCGTPTRAGHDLPGLEPRIGERTRVCPSCGLTAHPRIAPAVIVLVERGEEILLARSARFPKGLFSAVAGFVEVGESLEQAVAREVREEVGVQIEDIRYFGSQPWPFGRSLMVGFSARYAAGELRPDGAEIVECAWFSRAHLPDLPPKVSIARQLIEAFLER